MLKITSFTIENAPDICVTDEKKPHFRWTCESDQNGVSVEDAILSVNGWNCEVQNNLVTTYEGPELKPFSNYDADLLRLTMEIVHVKNSHLEQVF